MEAPSVHVTSFPQVIRVDCSERSESGRQYVIRSLRLELNTFDLVGWIEQTSSVDFVGHVVVDDSVYLSDGTKLVSNLDCTVDSGVRLVLFYTRAAIQ